MVLHYGGRYISCSSTLLLSSHLITGTYFDTTSCKPVNVTATTTVCKCYNASLIFGGGDTNTTGTHRRLTVGDILEIGSAIGVERVLMM